MTRAGAIWVAGLKPTSLPISASQTSEASLKRLFFLFALISASFAYAQQNELAITVGGQFPKNNSFDSGTSLAVGASFAHRLAHVPLASLYWELPLVVGPKSVLHLPSTSNYSSVFVAPGLKLKFAPELPWSPYLVGGVGVAHFRREATSVTPSDSATNAVYDFGGGLDVKVAPWVSFRGEVRDFYSGLPNFSGLPSDGRQHNVVAQTGLVLRF